MKHTKMRRLDGVVVLVPRKNLFGDVETIELTQAVKDLAEEGNRQLVVNLGEIELINSTGLGALIAGHVTYANRDGQVVLCCLEKKILDLFEKTKLITVFEIFDDEDQAVSSFAQGRATS